MPSINAPSKHSVWLARCSVHTSVVFNKEYQTGGKPAEIREEITPQKELSEKSKQELEDEIERLSLLIKIKELEKQKEELEERQYIKKKKEKDFEM